MNIIGNGIPRDEWIKRQHAGICCKCTKKGHVARHCPENNFVLEPFIVDKNESAISTKEDSVKVNIAAILDAEVN